MRNHLSRRLLFSWLLIWAMSHATVCGQQNSQPAVDKVRQALDKTITVDFSGQSLMEVLDHFRDKTGLTISLDQFTLMQMGVNPDDNIGQVSVKASQEKASQVLRKMLNAYRLTYIVLEDAILITTEDMAIYRQLRQRVSVDLRNVPFKNAVRELAKRHGVNLVIDPVVHKQIDTTISLQLENAGIETTIRLLAELASLKAVRMGNVMFITDEHKARKIREEEAHQMDNPLNPNVPGGLPGAFGGGAGMLGGGLGGIVPGRLVPAIPAPNEVPPPPVNDPPQAVPAPPAVKKIDPASDDRAPARKAPQREGQPEKLAPVVPAPPPPPVIPERPTIRRTSSETPSNSKN